MAAFLPSGIKLAFITAHNVRALTTTLGPSARTMTRAPTNRISMKPTYYSRCQHAFELKVDKKGDIIDALLARC